MSMKEAKSLYSIWENNYKNNPRLIYQWKKLNVGDKKIQSYITSLLVDNIKVLQSIEKSSRKCIFMHHGSTSSGKNSNQKEKRFAMALCHDNRYNGHYSFGTCVEYELPLCPRKNEYNHTNDKEGFGNIDLICRKNNEIYLIEVKKDKSDETLLRTILEAYTYWKQGSSILKKQIEADWGIHKPCIIPGILIFKGSKSEKELNDLEKNKPMKKLLRLVSADTGGFLFFEVNMTTMPDTKAIDKRVYFSGTWSTQDIIERKIFL